MKKRKVIITKLPEAKSGAEVKMDGLRAGLGFNANTMPWPVMAGKMSEPQTEVRRTLGPVPRHMANLEAEKDEIAMIPDQGGIPSTFIIGGKRHHSGGTPLFLPSDSFIFSDTAKMRIKDPQILKLFEMPPKKSGYTPAEIAKKYNVNKYKKILADPNSDKMQRETAELMISNYNLKLAKLAIYQESMKGFPQGIPVVAMPYLEEMGIDPAQFIQMNPGEGQDDTAEADAMSRYGGPHYIGGGSYDFNEFSPNAGATDAYEGIEGLEGKPLSGDYVDWERTGKPKFALSGIAKAEGILGAMGIPSFFSNAKQMAELEKQMKEKSIANNAMNAVAMNQGNVVGTGMAYGMQQPNIQGVTVRNPGYNMQSETVSKYGGDIDYFAPGGYLPKAQAGLFTNQWMPDQQASNQPLYPKPTEFSTEPDEYAMLDQWVKEEQAKKAQQAALDKASISSYFPTSGSFWSNVGHWLTGTPATGEETFSSFSKFGKEKFDKEKKKSDEKHEAAGIDKAIAHYNDYANNYKKDIEKTLAYMKNLKKSYDTQPSWAMALEPSLKTVQEELVRLRTKQKEVLDHINNLRKKKENIGKEQPSMYIASGADIEKSEDAQIGATPETPKDETIGKGKTKIDVAENIELTAPANMPSTTSTPANTSGPKAQKPAVKKAPTSYMGLPILEEKLGGPIGKRRVIINSLGEYKTGGALKTYETAGAVEKEPIGWVKKDGKYKVKFSDNTYSEKSYDRPLSIRPYKGKDMPTPYDEKQWLKFALDTDFQPTTDDPTEQTREFQKFLWEDKNWGPKIQQLHSRDSGYGLPKAGTPFDAKLGKRWEQLLSERPAPKKQPSETPPVAEDKAKPKINVNDEVFAEHLPQRTYPSVPPLPTIQDTLLMGNRAMDILENRVWPTWSAKPGYKEPDVYLKSPERQYAAAEAMYNTAANALASTGDPRQMNARLTQLAGQTMNQIADTASRTESENVNTLNQHEARLADIYNRYALGEAQRLTTDFENQQQQKVDHLSRKQYNRNAATRQLVTLLDNMANIYNMNQLYPQYAINPFGMMYFKNPRELEADNSKVATVSDYFNKLLSENEYLRSEKGMPIALKMAEDMAKVPSKSDSAQDWLRQNRAVMNRGVIPSYANSVNPYGYPNPYGYDDESAT